MSSLYEAIQKIRTVSETLPEDDPDKIEMMNVEGDYSALMDWVILKRAEALATEDAIKSLIEKYTIRKSMAANNAEKMKDILRILMESAGEMKYKSAVGTVTRKALPQKAVIVSPELVPDEYCKKEISKTLVNQAVAEGIEIPGVVMSNGGESVTVRIA